MVLPDLLTTCLCCPLVATDINYCRLKYELIWDYKRKLHTGGCRQTLRVVSSLNFINEDPGWHENTSSSPANGVIKMKPLLLNAFNDLANYPLKAALIDFCTTWNSRSSRKHPTYHIVAVVKTTVNNKLLRIHNPSRHRATLHLFEFLFATTRQIFVQ